MHAKNLLINDCCNWKAVEAICESLPNSDVVSTLAFIVEAIDSVDGGTLMVSSEQEEVLWVLDLVCKEEADCLH